MITLTELTKAYEDGRALFESMLEKDHEADSFRITEEYGREPANTISLGDNLDYMMYLIKEKDMSGRIQLIYVDPPFFSSGKYQASIRLESEMLGRSSLMKLEAYDDNWSKGMPQYLTMLTARLFAMKELLADTGCICLCESCS